MGRKTRNKKTQDEESVTEEELEFEENDIKPLWDILVLDAENELLNFTMEYEKTDSRFEWLNYGVVISAVEDVLFCKPEWLNFNIVSAKISNVIYDYITAVINILDLKNKPLLKPEYREFTLVDKYTYDEHQIYCNSYNDPQLDSKKYNIYEELIDIDLGVVDKLDQYENSLYIYLNYKILKEFKKYYCFI